MIASVSASVSGLRGTLRVCAVKAPGFADHRRALLQDIAILTGGRYLTGDLPITLENAALDDLGTALRITVTKDRTTIVGAGKGYYERAKIREEKTLEAIRLAGEVAIAMRHDAVRSVSISPEGDRLASAGEDHYARVWNLRTGLEQGCIDLTPDTPMCISWEPHGDCLAIGTYENGVFLWDLKLHCLRRIGDHPGGVSDIAIDRGGEQVISSGADAGIRFWRIHGGDEPWDRDGQKWRIHNVMALRDGRCLCRLLSNCIGFPLVVSQFGYPLE